MHSPSDEPASQELQVQMAALRDEIAELRQRMAACTPASPPRKHAPSKFRWLRIAGLCTLVAAALAQTASDPLVVDSKSGYVGVGTPSPKTQLDVAGTVRARGYEFSDGAPVMPSGAVVAFDATACPAGWAPYAAAYGRFIRGIDPADPRGRRAPGSPQDDAIQNITGTLFAVKEGYQRAWPWGFRPGQIGAISVNKDHESHYNTTGSTQYQPEGGVGMAATFDASRIVRTDSETRPRNVALFYCRKN